MMRRRGWIGAALAAAFLASCRTVPVAPPPPAPPPSAPHPTVGSTFGRVVVGQNGELEVTYKEMRLAVDPAPSSLEAMAPSIDFVLLTGSGGLSSWAPGVRRDLKILGPLAQVTAARKAGFANAKALEPGQRLMLSKASTFAFASIFSSTNAAAGGAINGYLLEFENGRNVLVLGDAANESPLREFVYSLRDDGKQLHLAFLRAGKSALEESAAAATASLLQPQVAVFIDRGGLDRAKLKDAFAEQIFDGGWFVASPQESVPF